MVQAFIVRQMKNNHREVKFDQLKIIVQEKFPTIEIKDEILHKCLGELLDKDILKNDGNDLYQYIPS